MYLQYNKQAGVGISKRVQTFYFSVESFDVLDYVTRNKELQYLLESRMLNNSPKKNCLDLNLSCDSGHPNSDLMLVLTNNCQLRFCVNFCTIFTLASKISDAVLKENIETAYYKEFAKAALSKIDQYIQLGVSYAVILFLNLQKDTYNTAEIKHFNALLNVNFSAPLIIIPEDSSSPVSESAFMCDLGKIHIKSSVNRKDKNIDYKQINDLKKLYDYYELKLEKIQIYIQNLTKNQNLKHKYVRDLSIQLRLYNCLEPLHPTLPEIKVGGILNRVDIVFTDYNILYILKILKNIKREQENWLQIKEEIIKKAKQKIILKQLEKIVTAFILDEYQIMKLGEIPEEEVERPIEEKEEEKEVLEIPHGKIKREIMIHLDDINIIIGSVI